MGITAKGNGECFVMPECHYTLSHGGGQAGQGYPAALVCRAFSLDSENSNSMRSPNPDSGCREVETARTLDTTNPCPSKGQGGVAVMDVHPEVTGTLVTSGAGMNRPGGMASEADLCVAYSLAGNMIGRQDHNGPRGSGVNEEVAFTVTATDVSGVAAPYQDVVGALCNGDHKGVGSQYVSQGKCIVSNYIVRRLLPVECERLMGFPDGWTEFSHDGKPISDTRRYQMLGNSIVVSVVAYILMGIAENMRKGAV